MHGGNHELLSNQLYLYTRKLYPGIPFEPEALESVLDEENITSMRQLYALDASGRERLAQRVLAWLRAASLSKDQGKKSVCFNF